MSHVVTIQTRISDPVAIELACQRLCLPAPQRRTVRLFSAVATGLAVELPGWRYPIVCQTDTGQLQYDNFQGRWGAQQQLDAFLQGYAVEKAKLAARQHGHTATEQSLPDGSIKLTIQVGVTP